ncbi:MAG TPA: ATP-binding protein [Conexibacter sp.]|jgi:signal transduction histidine kinase|nr:ATP-binding protein [Conexibacter sp.]
MTEERERVPRPPLVRRLTTSQWFALAASVLALVTAIGTALGVIAIVRLTDARRVVLDRNGPAVLAQTSLLTALVDQESGVRGYALSGNPQFLEPYRSGRVAERDAFAQLAQLTRDADMAQVRRSTALVRERADAWHSAYALPVIAKVRRMGASLVGGPSPTAGRRAFDALRTALARQASELERLRTEGRAHLTRTATFLTATFSAIVVLIAIGLAGALLALRVTTTRPLRQLGRSVRRVARGEFDHEIARAGARDVVDLADDVDTMRQRIAAELSSLRAAHEQLDEQARELTRSNAELEQFAYVASHDLQEPLRKVASFCQLIEQRYEDQLDDRGRQYIAFAVDGAKRMQQLINDLLDFSRVGHGPADQSVVAGDVVLRQALASLAESIEESGAQVEAGPLPPLRGEPALLAAVFQNLIGNALKFHGHGPPHVAISAERSDGDWLFTCADDGIGIESQYAERIFLIFQRLHAKDEYAGTGIGLAMCRKIVEYHGGRIWLDTAAPGGRTTFRFTLPAIDEEPG